MKVWVDDQRCRGHGMCLTLCPDVFSLTDDGYAVSIDSEVPAEFGVGHPGGHRMLSRAGHQREIIKRPRG